MKVVRWVPGGANLSNGIGLLDLSKSGSAIITKSIKKIHALIIDEAGQASEPDMLIPFQLNPEKVLIVGDECQLPPTVLSKNPEKFNYHWSMLSRLIVECGQSHFLLNTQYRMHPEISFFPVEAFYSSQVNDGVTADDRAPKKEIVSYQVLDVADGKEELDPISKSYKNIQEAFAVITLIADALKAGYLVSDIAVITPYKAQLKLLKDLAINLLKIENLTINTIDSFQGEESPVVFVSMVRANALGRIGFAKDFRRLNVAITRPQQILRIVMNGATFNPLHPRNEFQNSILQVFSEFHHIPLPGNDQFPKCYEEQDYDDYSDHQTQLSDNGYRRGLEDYSRNYRFHGLIHSDVIPDQNMVDNIWTDIYQHYYKRNVYIHGSNNGIYLYRKKRSTYALVMHNDEQHEILDLSDIKGAKHYIDKLAWPERGSSNDVGSFCLIELDWKFADLIARNCKDLLFNGPEPMYRFAKLLRHTKDSIPNTIGKLPIFFLSTLPKGTHIIQDILNHMKVWDNLSFVGLSDDIFSPFRYNTLTHVSETFEDYGYPFDDGDNYLSCGYSVGHNDYDEQEMEVENLVFKNHRFYRCDLSGVNFHNSKFINTTFVQCNLHNCKVNLDHMDEISRASFLKNAEKLHQSREQLPTDRLVLNAKQRGLYLPFFSDNKIDAISTPAALSTAESPRKPMVTFQKLVNAWSRESDNENLNAALAASKQEFLQTHGAHFNELVASYDLNLIDVPGDGNCFFHALLAQLQLRHAEILPIVLTRLGIILPRAVNHTDLRQLAVDSLLRAEESGKLSAVMNEINNYIADMAMDRSWADGIVIPILARALEITIVLINSDGNRPTFIDGGNAGTVYLGYQVGVHFQSTIGEPNLQMMRDMPMQPAIIAVQRQTSAGSIDFYNKITSLSIEQMEAVLRQHPNRANACSKGEKGLSVLAVLINSFM